MTMTARSSTPARPTSNADRDALAARRAAVAADLHPDAGRRSRRAPASTTGPRRPAAVRLHLRRARLQPRPQPDPLDDAVPSSTWAGRRRRHPRTADGYFAGRADDRLQRRHAGRGRGEPAAGRTAPQAARRRADGTGDVGRVRVGGDPEGALGGAWPATAPGR